MSDSSEKREPDLGNNTSEPFVYEIMSLCLVTPSLCLVIPLTNPRKLCKIRGIQGTKEKTASGPSALATSTKELPTAHSHRKSVAASGALVKYSLHGHWRSFLWLRIIRSSSRASSFPPPLF